MKVATRFFALLLALQSYSFAWADDLKGPEPALDEALSAKEQEAQVCIVRGVRDERDDYSVIVQTPASLASDYATRGFVPARCPDDLSRTKMDRAIHCQIAASGNPTVSNYLWNKFGITASEVCNRPAIALLKSKIQD